MQGERRQRVWPLLPQAATSKYRDPHPRPVTVLIVGAGVMGLSTGIRLREAGVPAHIVARERTPHTTSDVAAALYWPFLAEPKARILAWGRRTFDALDALSRDPDAHVTWSELLELHAHPQAEPWWRDMVPGYRRAFPHDLPPGYADGFLARIPIIAMGPYLQYLERRFQALGGTLETGTVTDLGSLEGQAPVVVNCSGLGARELAKDDTMYPVRGQILRVANRGTVARSFIEEEGPRAIAYAIVRPDCIVLGGTAEAGNWNLIPDEATEADIRRRCAEIDPATADLPVASRAVGLRPGRPTIRLEAERLTPRLTVVHNYGHGGSGVTLSWGCGEEAARLARAALP